MRSPSWKKSSYLYDGLNDRHEIWHVNAFRHSWRVLPLKIRNFKNPRWRRPPSWTQIGKLPYLSRGDAVWSSWPFWPLKIKKFLNPRWRQPPSWEIQKLWYLGNGFTNRHEIWHGYAYWPSEQVRNFPTYTNQIWWTSAILKNPKMAISLHWFDRSAHHLAIWCILALQTGLVVEISNF